MIHLGQRERMIKYMIKNLFTCLLCLCVLVGCDNSEDKVSHNYSHIYMYKPFSSEYGINLYKDDADTISDIIFDGYHEVSEDEYNANDTVELMDMIVIDCDDDTYWILNNGYGFLSKDDTKFYIKYDDQVYDTLNDIVEDQSISE